MQAKPYSLISLYHKTKRKKEHQISRGLKNNLYLQRIGSFSSRNTKTTKQKKYTHRKLNYETKNAFENHPLYDTACLLVYSRR